MKALWRAIFAMGSLVVAGCGREPPEETVSVARSDQGETATNVLRVRGCSYAVATVALPTLPPTFQVSVTRLRSRLCEEASALLPQPGSNFIERTPLVTTTRSQAIVAAFAFKSTPSGAAAVAAEMVAVSPDTLAPIRTAELRTLNTQGTATVDVESLLFQGTSLIVEGAEAGTFGPGGAQGTHFTATFPRFLDSGDPPVIDVSP